MDEFIQRLTDLLQASFARSEVEFEPAGAGRVGGFLIWQGFAGLEHIERQRNVWKILRQKLNAEEQLKVAAVLTLTPEEMAAAREG